MSNLPISSKYVSRADAAVDVAEREAMVTRVNAAFEAGDFDEVSYRHYLDVTFSAKTLGQLRPVAEALGVQPTYATPSNIVAATVAPGEVSTARAPGGRLIGLWIAGGVLALVVLVLVLTMLL